MNKKIIIAILSIIIVIILGFCLSNKNKLKEDIVELKTEIEQVNNENKKLFSSIEDKNTQISIKDNEIFELRFGKQNLFSEINELLKLKSYKKAKEKISILKAKHPNAIETTKSELFLPSINEEILWVNIKDLRDVDLIENYIYEYPNGKYSNKVNALKKEILKENEEKAYTSAKQKNTIYGWNSFLNNYPNHWNSESIKKKIINLEIDNIIGDSKTGRLPNFSKTSYNYSSTSYVTIDNDTGYELTLRYSGPSIIKITIPRGQSRTTTLISGQYKISASANGLHYGGNENLTGDYNSSYYITTSHY